jgi:SAM-dependent methyltransferase
MAATRISVQAPPPGPPVTTTIWATPESRVPVQPAVLSPATIERQPLRTRIKAVIREVTPPALYKAAHRIRQRRASKVPAEASPTAVPVSRATNIPDRPNLAYRHALALEGRVPELKAFGLKVTPQDAEAILDFYNAVVPLIREEARGSHQRTLLARLRKTAPGVADQASRLIARLDLADGLPDRAQRWRGDPEFGADLSKQTEAFENAFGAKVITEKWGAPSRGASLLHYLKHHTELVAGKDVLHVAPEDELRSWLQSTTRRYTVLDGVPDAGTDIGADITAIPLADKTCDFILCHRVLEHVLDDTGAMRELHRILRPGGTLNMSVPQAVHRQHTAEWLVPDESHDWHVRQYGQDLAARLESAGFSVRVITWLCEQPRDHLLAVNAIPMRLYAATRSQ